ncbi:hypothetical protein HELRODRAFT_77583, partial [Helobdella robusta]|uniref:TOG domain-containing protein n=1 Tax=Helobdella robusta TaxID=6412 RepID=T1G301_HELRO
SSTQVSLLGLEVVHALVSRMKANFKQHITSVLSVTIDRLGDSKDQVRDCAKKVLLSFMVPASNPQYIIERLTPAFTHKLWKVKEESLCLVNYVLNEWGAKSIIISKLIPLVVKMMEDSSVPVREQAVLTLVEFYRHVGERVRQDICKRDIQPSKLSILTSKMDEAKNKGLMIASYEGWFMSWSNNEPDGPVEVAIKKAPRSKSTGRSQVPPIKSIAGAGSQSHAGALDEELFCKSFDDVPKIFISSSKDLIARMEKVKDTLNDTNKDWELRQDALKSLRSLVVANATKYPEFLGLLKGLGPALRVSVLDLRSQIVREACITLGYLSQELGRDFEQMAEYIIPAIIQLLPNSAKVMSTSGLVVLKFILQYTQSHRLIPLITCNLASKSNIIRRLAVILVYHLPEFC